MNLNKLIKALEGSCKNLLPLTNMMLVIANKLGTENAMPMAIESTCYDNGVFTINCTGITNSKRLSYVEVYDNLLHIRRVYGNKEVVVNCIGEEDEYIISETKPIRKVRTDYYSDKYEGYPMYTFSQMKELGWSEAVIGDSGLVIVKNDIYLSINRKK